LKLHGSSKKANRASRLPPPSRDFYLAASEDYVVLEERVGETTIRSYAPLAYEQHAELILEFARDAL
jgi:hypothetical protein